MATQRSDLADIVSLLEEGADLDSVKEGSMKQETAWRLAVATGDPSLLKVLLRYIPTYKLDSPVSFVEGMTPLMIFAASGSLECIRYTIFFINTINTNTNTNTNTSTSININNCHYNN
jgi:hypothetical protein